MPSVLWCCWLGGRKGIRPVKKLEWWGAGMVICLEQGADLLMPLPLTVSCFSKIQIGFTFLVPAHSGSPGQRAVKRVCVCLCVLHANYLCKFLKIQWLHFTDVVDKVAIAYFQFVLGFNISKIIKIGSFLTELLKMEMSLLFETRCNAVWIT